MQLYVGPGSPQNADEDAAIEFSNTNVEMDNWLCGTRTTQLWDWDGATYVRQPDRVEQLDCTAREAEEAMWAGDFETAVERYETFFEQYTNRWAEYIECISAPTAPTCDYTLFPQIYRYFQGRRIVAYTLLSDTTRVQELLDEATSTEYHDAFMEALLTANTVDAETLCRVAYDYFSTYRPPRDQLVDPLLAGEVIPNIYGGWDHAIGYRVNPARAGCDISHFDETLSWTPTPLPTMQPTYPPLPPDTRTVEQQWIDNGNVYGAFIEGDYQTAQRIAEAAIPRDDFDAARLQYWQAFVYEALDRPDDALSEFINLYMNYPGSWWAWLAGLHLERIET